jgi:general L-amino acid transport system substrate-binding protein
MLPSVQAALKLFIPNVARVIRTGFFRWASLASVPLAAALPAQTLLHIRQSHTLRCGTIVETAEYSSSDDHGPRTTFDADLCRAVAVAILGPHARTIITAYPDDVAATAALRAHAVDLVPTLTLDLSHASDSRITFSPPVLYDGVGFLVSRAAKLGRADQLTEKKICFLAETQVEVSLRAWFAWRKLSFVAFPFQEEGEMEAAFVTGNCAALAGDLTRLAATRLNFGPLAAGYTLLPEGEPVEISNDPLASASSSSDPGFANVVRWMIEVLLNAEAVGLTQQTVAAPSGAREAATSDPTVVVLTGQSREIGRRLGLKDRWGMSVIAAVGNYGELYERDLGAGSAVQLPRSKNRLSSEGGLMVALPLK